MNLNEPKWPGRFEITDGEAVTVLSIGEIVQRCKTFAADAKRSSDESLVRAARIGWWLLQMREHLKPWYGRWSTFQTEVGVHRATLNRYMRIADETCNQFGIIDPVKLKAIAERYESVTGEPVAPEALTMRKTQIALGHRTAQTTVQNTHDMSPMGDKFCHATVQAPKAFSPLDDEPWGGRRDDIEDEVEGDDDFGGDFGGDEDSGLASPAPIVQAPAKPAGAAGAQMTFDAIYDAAMARIATKFTEFRSAPMSTARRAALRWFAEDMEAKLQTILREVP